MYFLLILCGSLLGIAQSCELFLAKSRLGFGRGVFAGRNYAEGEIIMTVSELFIPEEYTYRTQLNNYASGTIFDEIRVMHMDFWTCINHADDYNVDTEYIDAHIELEPVSNQQKSHSMSHRDLHLIARRNIFAGDELFDTFGGRTWFIERFGESFEYVEPTRETTSYDMTTLAQIGHCISDVAEKPSTIPGASNGLFAQKPFKAGEVVTVSPVLALPIIPELNTNIDFLVLTNYLITKPMSTVVFLPIGLISMINHGDEITGSMYVEGMDNLAEALKSSKANVQLLWAENSVAGLSSSHVLNTMSVDDILHSDYSLLDVVVIATRDIEAGEEILLDYGPEWVADYSRYLTEFQKYQTVTLSIDGSVIDEGSGLSAEPFPIFRHPILPQTLEFPNSWLQNE